MASPEDHQEDLLLGVDFQPLKQSLAAAGVPVAGVRHAVNTFAAFVEAIKGDPQTSRLSGEIGIIVEPRVDRDPAIQVLVAGMLDAGQRTKIEEYFIPVRRVSEARPFPMGLEFPRALPRRQVGYVGRVGGEPMEFYIRPAEEIRAFAAGAGY